MSTRQLHVRFAPLISSSRLLVVAWAILLAILFVLAIDSFIHKPVGDSPLFIYVAEGMLAGEIPYLDRWDNKGPLQYLVNAAGLLIHETWGIWLIQVLFLLATSVFAFLVVRRIFGSIPALFALALLLIFYRDYAPEGNFTEQYALLFQFLTLYLFMRSQDQPDRAPTLPRFALQHLSIGALGAAAFLLRPNLVFLWIVIGLYWLILRGGSLRKLAWAVIGGGGVLLITAGFFFAVGAWDALWSAVFEFNFTHSNASFLERREVVWDLTKRMYPASFLTILGWGIGVYWLARRRTQAERRNPVLLVAVILLPLELVGLSISGFKFEHYYLVALPAISLLLAFLVSFIIEKRAATLTFLSAMLLFGAAYYSSPYSRLVGLVEKYTQGNVLAEDAEVRLAKRIQELTGPEDPILVWGKAARIYLLSDRIAPSRFFYHVPLVKPNYADQSIREEFFSDVRETPPRLIIESGDSRFAPLERSKRDNWQPRARYVYDPEEFSPFFAFVEQNYVAVGSVPPFTVYVLESDVSANLASVKGDLIIQSTFDVYLDNRTLTYVKDPCVQEDLRNIFILHVIPVNISDTRGNAQANLDFEFGHADNWRIGNLCVVSRNLPDYPIAFIRTGQYNASRTGDEWLGEYRFANP